MIGLQQDVTDSIIALMLAAVGIGVAVYWIYHYYRSEK